MLTDLSPKGGEVKDPSPCADHLTRFASLTDLSPKGGEVPWCRMDTSPPVEEKSVRANARTG